MWAGWRGEYVVGGDAAARSTADGCPLCGVIAASAGGNREAANQIVAQDHRTVVMVNAFPYNSGHLLVMPRAHVADLLALDVDVYASLFATVRHAVRAVCLAYRPDGVNIGANLGRAAGAGVPGHVHVHVLPRWDADTTFTTTVANTRVLPEALQLTGDKLRAAW